MILTWINLQLLKNFDITIANPLSPWSSQCYGIFFQKDFKVLLHPVDNGQPPAYKDIVKCFDIRHSK